MLATRFITAIIALPVFMGFLLWLPNLYWAFFLLLFLLTAAREWAVLAGYGNNGRWSFPVVVSLSALCAFFIPFTPGDSGKIASHLSSDGLAYGIAALFWLGLVPLWLAKKWRPMHPLLMGLTGWIVLVPTWLALVRLQIQPINLLMVLGIVWIADSAAYVFGKAMGKHKLAPDISPGKTWEGVIGACATVAVYYAFLAFFFDLPAWIGGVTGIALFGLLTIMSIEGDLFESAIKRRAGVKDSGSLFPGHGGVLDRIDGLTAVMPIAALASLYIS
jgi:phosphatidate cytidylyltransferase